MIIRIIKVVVLIFLIVITINSVIDILNDLLAIHSMQDSIREEIEANKDLNEKYEEFIESRK